MWPAKGKLIEPDFDKFGGLVGRIANEELYGYFFSRPVQCFK